MNVRSTTAAATAALAFAIPATAAEAPTIRADPEIVGATASFALEGSVPSRRAGEDVVIEARDCISGFFRTWGATQTRAGGTWRLDSVDSAEGLEGNTYFRARAAGATSAPVLVRQRMFVALDVRGRGRFIARVVARLKNMHGRAIRLERFSARGWVLVRTATLRRVGPFHYQVAMAVRSRGLQLRAAVTDRAARPCYLAGVSPIVRS